MDPRLIDKRVIKRNMNTGVVTKDQFDKYLAGLQDMAANAEPVREKLYGNLEEEAPMDDDDSADETDE